MLWEKKTQLAREAKATVDSEVGQGEIRAMTAEIHRMEVRYTQLMKLQENLIQDMEKSVSRRDTIVTRGGAQAKLNKKVETKGTFQKKLMELRKKIKQTQQVRVIYTLSHLENDRDVSAYFRGRRLQLCTFKCFIPRSNRNTEIDA